MSMVETTGKTVEEALSRALVDLGKSREEVEYEVLEQPSNGFLGLFSHPAKLRVTAKEAAPVQQGKETTEKKQEKAQAAASVPETSSAQSQNAGNSDASRSSDAAGPAVSDASDDVPQARAEEFLKAVFRCMALDVHFTAEQRADGIFYDLMGENLGILIGKHGQTLDALQYLTNLAANRGRDEGRVHITLDVEGYRSRREETLRRLAGHLAEKACRLHSEVRLEPMNRHERKIIHMALQDNHRVNTYSDGDEPYRCVVIAPKRRRYRAGGYRENREYENRESRYEERDED